MKYKQPKKKYTLTFFLCIKNGSDILETIEGDEWFEVTEENIIYVINKKEDYTIAFPKINLRQVRQNYQIYNYVEDHSIEKPPEGYN